MRALFAVVSLCAGCSKLLGITDPSTGDNSDGRPVDAPDGGIDSAIDAPPACTTATAFGGETSFTVDLGATGVSLAVGKFDAGNTVDVAVAIGSDVVILHNDGTGGFVNPLKLGSVAGQVLVEDFDATGSDDLILVEVGGTNIAERRQVSPGNFAAAQPLDGPFANLHRAAIGFLDGNLVPDLYVEDDNARRQFTANLGNPGTFTRENTTIGAAGDELVTILELDKTGRDDTVLVDGGGAVKVSLGSAAAPGTIGQGDATTKHGVAFGNFNGDALPDMIVATANGGVLYFQDPANPGTFVQQAGLVGDVTGGSLQVLDVNGDGTDDIVTPTHVVLQCPGGGAKFTQVEAIDAAQPALLVDVNKNGKPDLLRVEGDTLKVRLQ